MALVLNGSGVITGVTDLATAGVTLDDAALTNPVVTGGVYLGGTGAANYLDDYEEGTWTPEYVPQSGAFTSVTYDYQTGYYIKVGNLVFLSGFIRTDAITKGTASGSVVVSNLPFTANSSQYGYSIGSASSEGFLSNDPTGLRVNANETSFTPLYGNGDASNIDVSDFNTGANDNGMRFSVCYIAA